MGRSFADELCPVFIQGGQILDTFHPSLTVVNAEFYRLVAQHFDLHREVTIYPAFSNNTANSL